MGLSAQLAYKSSCPFRKHRNSRPPIYVSGPFHLRKLVVAPESRNWSRGGRDIDPRPRRFEQGGRSRSQQTYKKGHAPLFSRPRPGCRALVFLPAAGPWVSALNLLTKIPSLFENIGTRGHQSAFLAHFTYESLLWRRKTGTGAGVDVI